MEIWNNLMRMNAMDWIRIGLGLIFGVTGSIVIVSFIIDITKLLWPYRGFTKRGWYLLVFVLFCTLLSGYLVLMPPFQFE